MNNMDIYNKVRSVPVEAQKTINAGRLKGMTDINPQWRIQMLTELFGACGFGWKYEVTKQWIEDCGDEKVACVNINLYVKVDLEWSEPIFGTGGSMLSTTQKNGVYVSDECYKMATTDAISVACKQLGFGADIYWGAGRTKYSPVTAEQKEEAKDHEKTEAIKQMKISTIKVNAIRNKIDDDGVDLDKFYALYNIKNLSDMTEEQYRDACTNWTAKIKVQCV